MLFMAPNLMLKAAAVKRASRRILNLTLAAHALSLATPLPVLAAAADSGHCLMSTLFLSHPLQSLRSNPYAPCPMQNLREAFSPLLRRLPRSP